MIYEVQARLLFSEEDEADDFFHDCELALAKTVIVNLGQPNSEASIVMLVNNNHELQPNEPCKVLKLVQKSG